MEIYNRGIFKIASFDCYQHYIDNFASIKSDIHFIEIKSKEKIASLYSFWGPRYVGWRKEITTDFFDPINPSHHKKIRKALHRCEKEGVSIKIFDTIPQDLFSKWLNNLYKPFLASKNCTSRIDENWPQSGSGSKHKALFVYLNDEMIEGSFYRQFGNRKLSFSFKAILHTLPFDLNPFLEKTYFDIAKQSGVKYLNKGLDFNLYGGHLSLGLYEYKLKYGFNPFNNIDNLSIKEKSKNIPRYLLINNPKGLDKDSITFVFENDDIKNEKLVQVKVFDEK